MFDKLDFEVDTSPVIYEGKTGNYCRDEDYKVIHRTDNDNVMSVMKSSYHPLKVEDFKKINSQMLNISGFEHEGFQAFKGGKIILSFLKNNNGNMNIGGNEIKDYLVIGSSFDGSYPIFIGTSTIVVRCTNAFGLISKHNKIRHTKSSDVKIEQLIASMDLYFEERNVMQGRFELWNSINIDNSVIDRVVENIVQLEEDEEENSTRKLNTASNIRMSIDREINAVGKTAWGIFNGLTYYSTHVMKNKNTTFGSIVGPAASFNKKAVKAVELITY